MKKINSIILRAICLALFSFSLMIISLEAEAEIRLPSILSSNMVIQRNEEIKIWGWADKGESVNVLLNNTKKSVKTGKDGKWAVTFPAMKEGGPYEILITGKNSAIKLENILVGDVWVCGGQSNMNWSVRNSLNSEEEIKNASFPNIRLLTIALTAELNPKEEVSSSEWKICTPENIPGFSAVAYFFGREIFKETGVPVGLIHSSFGGTIVESWISSDFMTPFLEYSEQLKFLDAVTPAEIESAENHRIAMIENEFGIIKGKIPEENWADPATDLSYWKNMGLPGRWEDKNLNGIDGVVWFRKEIILPENSLDANFTLSLGKIDDSDITWINGIEVGRTDNNKDLPRSYNIKPGIFKPGKNVIVVKVSDKEGDGGFLGTPDDMNVVGKDVNISLSGNWNFRISGENLSYTLSTFGKNAIPSQLFYGMIHPLLNLKVKGVIWYQGESNTPRAYRYRELFPTLINCWRSYWNQPDMPFLFVQIANFKAPNPEPGESEWAELREAQLMTLSMPNTGMAVAIDIGEANDIHPRNKQDVGYRLAMNALKVAYNKNVVRMGPVYRSMEKKEGKIMLSFDHIGSGLEIKDKYGYLKGFSIAGEDKKFHWAKAYMEGERVVVYSENVPSPVAVRYGWADNPDDGNL